MKENEIGRIVVDCAVKLHKATGPGLLESVYEALLEQSLAERGLRVQRQVAVPLSFNGQQFIEAFRADLIVEDKVILELKSVEKTSPAHHKQLQTYLKLSGKRLGFLLNFGAAIMKEGITRMVNNLPESSSAA